MRKASDSQRQGIRESRSIETSPTAAPGAPRQPRALTADFVRVVLFTLVVVTHSVNAIATTDVIRNAGLVGTLLHLTRYGFVAVTLYVLVLSMRGKTMSPLTFWRKRFGLVVAPYLIWTVLYSVTDHIVIRHNPFPPAGEFFTSLAQHSLIGEGKYQLYFLLISMQIYLFFPALAWMHRKVGSHPWWILGVAAAIQATYFVVYQYLPRPGGPAWTFVYDHGWKLLPMYALFIAIGMLAAHHRTEVDAWMREHAVGVMVAAGLCLSFSVAMYLMSTTPGVFPAQASTPWNLASLPWYLGGFALLWLIALMWNDRISAGRGLLSAAFVTWATLRAFGVFVIHPLILDILARIGFFDFLFADGFPNSLASRAIILVSTVLVLSLASVELILRLPFSKWLVARPRVPLSLDWLRRITARIRATRRDGRDEEPTVADESVPA
uniref:acyltransferase n=1 Tax=Gordonia sp. B7-2 TaxID=3420932 RepID=UPI003D8D8670